MPCCLRCSQARASSCRGFRRWFSGPRRSTKRRARSGRRSESDIATYGPSLSLAFKADFAHGVDPECAAPARRISTAIYKSLYFAGTDRGASALPSTGHSASQHPCHMPTIATSRHNESEARLPAGRGEPFGLDRPISPVRRWECFQVPKVPPWENREGGEIPLRAQRCDGDCPDIRHWPVLGRRSDGVNLSQKTGRKAIGSRHGRAVARAFP